MAGPLVAFRLGPLTIYWYGIIIMTAAQIVSAFFIVVAAAVLVSRHRNRDATLTE